MASTHEKWAFVVTFVHGSYHPSLQVSGDRTSVVYLCPVCDYESSMENQHHGHIELHHWETLSSGARLHCTTCEVSCESLTKMIDHARAHRSAMWQCAECAYVVPHSEMLEQEHHVLEEHRHLRVNQMGMHTCKMCLLMFPTRPALGYHQISIHEVSSAEMPVDILKPDDRKVQCNYCEAVLADRKARREHIVATHGQPTGGLLRATVAPNQTLAATTNSEIALILTQSDVKVMTPTMEKLGDPTMSKPKNIEAHDRVLRLLLGSRCKKSTSCSVRTPYQTRYFCPNCDAVYHMTIQYAEHIMRCHWRLLAQTESQFVCVICEAEYNSVTAIIIHMEMAHLAELWPCGDCPAVFPKAETSQRNRHRHLEHQGPRLEPPTMLKCKQCEAKVGTQRELCYHYITTHGEFNLTESLKGDDVYRCLHCSATFQTHRKLILHSSKQHPRHRQRHMSSKIDTSKTDVMALGDETEEGRLESGAEPSELAWMEMCPVCDAHYYMRKPLDRHLADVHWTSPNPGVYRCVECGDSDLFESLLEIVTHTRACQQESLWRCTYCPAAFPQEELWQRSKHRMLEHRRERCREANEYSCPHCSEKFVQTSELSFHQMDVHNDMSMRLEEVSHVCNYCAKEFAKERMLVNHTKKHNEVTVTEPHMNMWVRPSVDKRRVIHKRRVRPLPKMTPEIRRQGDGERLVGDTMKSVVDVDQFEQTEAGFKCKQCLKLLRTHAGAARHDCSTWVTSAKRDFLCSICGRIFKQRVSFDRHMSIAHVKNGSFICGTCGRNFTTRRVLTMHMLSHSKPFLCVHCGKAFSQQAHLKEHQAKHTGDQSFACDICAKTFTWRMSLRRHRYACHKLGIDPERGDNQRAQCSLCAKIVSVKARAAHFKQGHKDVAYTTSLFARINKPVPGELAGTGNDWVAEIQQYRLGGVQDVGVVTVDTTDPPVDLMGVSSGVEVTSAIGAAASLQGDMDIEMSLHGDVGVVRCPIAVTTHEEVVETQSELLQINGERLLMAETPDVRQVVLTNNQMTFVLQHPNELQQVQQHHQVVTSQPSVALHTLQVNAQHPVTQPDAYH